MEFLYNRSSTTYERGLLVNITTNKKKNRKIKFV